MDSRGLDVVGSAYNAQPPTSKPPMSIGPKNLLLSSQEAILIVSNHKVTLENHVDNYTKTKESQIFHLLESFVMILTKVGLSFPSLTWK